jgi:hypothetical protein
MKPAVRFPLGILVAVLSASAQSALPDLFPFPNESGLLQNHNINQQPIPLTGAFFQSLGTNGRAAALAIRPPKASRFPPPKSVSAFY